MTPLFFALLMSWLAQGTDPVATHHPTRLWSFSTGTMGTVATLQIAARDSAEVADLAYDALLAFHHADSLLSNWTDESEIARVNREAPHGWVELHPELAAILETAGVVHEESEGAFDPTIEPLVRAWGFLAGTPHVPSQAEIDAAFELVGWNQVNLLNEQVRFASEGVSIDLGGIAKGYAVDEAAMLLDRGGARGYLLDLSGNMVARGGRPGRPAWRIGIRDPRDEIEHLGTLTLRDVALATSGDYEQFVDASGKRYGHILDPRTGGPVEGMAQVTVLAPTAMQADAWATAMFVLGGDEGRRIAAERPDLSAS